MKHVCHSVFGWIHDTLICFRDLVTFNVLFITMLQKPTLWYIATERLRSTRLTLVLSLLRFSEMTSELIAFNHLTCCSSSTALGTRTGCWKPTRRGTDEMPPYTIDQFALHWASISYQDMQREQSIFPRPICIHPKYILWHFLWSRRYATDRVCRSGLIE